MNDLTHFNKRSPIFIIILGSLTAIGALSIDMFCLDYQILDMIFKQRRLTHN